MPKIRMMVASEGRRSDKAEKRDVNLICNVVFLRHRKRSEANKNVNIY